MDKVQFSRTAGAPFGKHYGIFIDGKWADAISGKYLDNRSPVNGQVLCEVAHSDARDVEAALDAAHAVKDAWGRTSIVERALILNRFADRMENYFDLLALWMTQSCRQKRLPCRRAR